MDFWGTIVSMFGLDHLMVILERVWALIQGL